MLIEDIQEVRRQVREYVVSSFYVADAAGLADSASLIETGIVDSTGVLEMVAFLESTFAVKVDDDEMRPENLDSIARIAAFVCRKTADAAPILGVPVEEAGDDAVDDVGMGHGGHVTDAVELDQLHSG
jgi:acyl carrier protein